MPVLMQVTAADELAQGVDAVQQAVSNIERFGKSEWLRAPRWLWGRASMRMPWQKRACGSRRCGVVAACRRWLQCGDGKAAAMGGTARIRAGVCGLTVSTCACTAALQA